jgi:hypothetical protein
MGRACSWSHRLTAVRLRRVPPVSRPRCRKHLVRGTQVGARLLAPAPGPWKAADVERFPDDGYRYEIWHGELVRVVPPGGRHGECEANLVAGLRQQTRAGTRVHR